MDTSDQQRERRRLMDLYGSMSDGELDSIARDTASLTDVARQVLQEERVRRQMTPQAVAAVEDEQAEWEDLIVLKQFRDLPEALLAKGSLDSSGITSFLADDNLVRMDWFYSNFVGGIKLCVRPQDADAAMEILEQPPPAEFEIDDGSSYQQPSCPECRSLDVSFETLNKPAAYASAWIGVPIPVRRTRWKCHSCGHVWPAEEASGDNNPTM